MGVTCVICVKIWESVSVSGYQKAVSVSQDDVAIEACPRKLRERGRREEEGKKRKERIYSQRT